MQDQNIGIAMSGGVDSTACALLLKDHYRVKGFFMQLAQPNFREQKSRVESIADKIGIPLQVIDLRQEFEKKVLNYFSGSYFQGLTPNPCVICNREIKFGLFLDSILNAGLDKMATGHYSRIQNIDNIFRLYTGDDPRKDQSYFLSRLTQKQLAKILFPLGDKTKSDIYSFVKEYGFDDFEGQESQDICFLENSEIGSFLEHRVADRELTGPIVSASGKQLGSHRGLYRYTIGQRKGLGISSDAPLYVIGLDVKRNAVVVGGNEELFKKRLLVKDVHWLAETQPDITKEYKVRIRYSHRGSTAQIHLHDNNRGEIIFHEPQRAVTPGQFAVVYDDAELLGSGIIEQD